MTEADYTGDLPEDHLEALKELISDARSVPLSSSAMVDREHALELVNGALAALPPALREARWVLEDRTAILERARTDAAALLEQAGRERDELVSSSEVLRTAQREAVQVLDAARSEADELLETARRDAERLRSEAEGYVDGRLSALQDALTRALDQVERGRYRLRRDRDPGTGASDEPVGGLDEPVAPEVAGGPS